MLLINLKNMKVLSKIRFPNTTIQTALVNIKGKIFAFSRDTSGKMQLHSMASIDNGLSWSEVEMEKAIINPNSANAVISLHRSDAKDDLLIMVGNVGGGRDRESLSVLISYDGTSWKEVYTLEGKTDYVGIKSNQLIEYSYPFIINRGNGELDIFYTWNRQAIKHVVLKIV